MAPAVGLTYSLASHFALIYALAIFLPSLVVLLAGSFLTLDRTRSFENKYGGDKYGPIYKAFKPRKKSETIWRFDGGVGGLLTGFLFGLHFASLVALVVANRTSAAPLSSGAFLAIWMTFSLLFAIGGALWNALALIITAVLGGASVAIFLATAFHPSLTARIVLLGLLLIIGLLGTFLPILVDRDLNRWTLRAAEACTGALGVIVGISIFTGIPGWGSAWLRLVVKDDDAAWSSSKEKGLAVVFLLFALIGSASDWYLARRYGADPAQKWDSYLASLPPWNGNAQAEGNFQPSRTLWQRMFQKKARSGLHPRLFDIENTHAKDATDYETTHEPVNHRDPPTSHQLQAHAISLPPCVPMAFRPQAQPCRTDDHLKRPLAFPSLVAEADESRLPLTLPPQRLSTPTSIASISSGTTVVGASLRAGSTSDERNVEVVDISGEGDGSSTPKIDTTATLASRYHSPPASSVSRSFTSSSREVHSIPEEPEVVDVDETSRARQTDNSPGESDMPSRPSAPGTSPLDYQQTPSLIRAFDRIERARIDARARGARLKPPPPTAPLAARAGSTSSTPTSSDRGELFNEEEWEVFWQDVRAKAAVTRQ